MATYFHGNSEIQGGGDGLQTLILMNPAYVGYSETQHQLPPPAGGGGNFVFLGPNSAGNHQDVSELHSILPRIHYNFQNPSADIGAARDVMRSQQGLSLSLSSQQPTGYGSFWPDQREAPPSQPPPPRGENVRISGGSPSSASGISNSVTGMQNAVLGSTYLKAAQELLDEVVNIGKAGNSVTDRSAKVDKEQTNNIGESSMAAAAGDGQSGEDSIAKRGSELTTAEKQEIQMKKAKLGNMLDEVEQSYKQYNNQMQIVISLFEQVAGIGSAKTYTALALQTISKQFRCLKDAILGQIRASSKSLGEEDHSLGGKIEAGSRLKYVDHQIRQQRALQQLGMIQHNAWRPQRGLPERSVSVLRAWLFEHFLHPYPKDTDKLMLAKQTGLTRSQVSNWFINARVRLWKPMVEEMYAEEMKERERNGAKEKTTKTERNQVSSPTGANMKNNAGLNITGSSQIEKITQGSPKKPCNADTLQYFQSTNVEAKPTNLENEPKSMKFGTQRQGTDGFTLTGAPTNFIGEFNSYPIVDQFQAPYSGNGVSLTLGLPHGESLSMSGGHQNFLPNQSIQLGRGVEIGEANGFTPFLT